MPSLQIKAATDQEQISFAHEVRMHDVFQVSRDHKWCDVIGHFFFCFQVMEWSITHNSANILTHLRMLGYSIPLDIIKRYPTVIRDYLLGKLLVKYFILKI